MRQTNPEAKKQHALATCITVLDGLDATERARVLASLRAYYSTTIDAIASNIVPGKPSGGVNGVSPCTTPTPPWDCRHAFDTDIYDCERCGQMIGDHEYTSDPRRNAVPPEGIEG